MPDEKFFFLILFFSSINFFTVFWWGGPPPGCKLRRQLAIPRRQRAFASFAARAPVIELCVVTGPSARIVRLNFKNLPKVGV